MTAPYIRRQSSPFLKRVLIPFWILRTIILLAGLASYGLVLAALIVFTDDILEFENTYDTRLSLASAKAIIGVVMGLLLLCLILELVCFIKRCRRTLSPAFFLGANIVQSVFIIGMFILSMIGARTPANIGISVAILIIFLAFLLYSAFIYHKYRNGKLDGDAEHGAVSHDQYSKGSSH